MLFKLDIAGSTPRQEIRAGVTTFMTMAYTFLRLVSGRWREVSPTMWILSILFLIRFFI